MVSRAHEEYRAKLRGWLLLQSAQERKRLMQMADVICVLWHLDLEGARPILGRCYAARPRGQRPHDPVCMLRALLLAILLGETSFTKWVERGRCEEALRVLAGFDASDFAGVGTFYDYRSRIQDGPLNAFRGGVERPSTREKRRAKTPRPKNAATQHKSERETAAKKAVSKTQALVAELLKQQDHALPDTFCERLNAILLHVAVLPSAKEGLLGKTDGIQVVGDGSPLVTGANGQGQRTCNCPRYAKCDCPRLYSDPDARWGWDHYRKTYFFGHHFWELGCSSEGHDLPLALDLDAGNASDHLQGARTLDSARKRFEPHGLRIKTVIEDSGHDSSPLHQYMQELQIEPIIPLAKDGPAYLPGRDDIALSRRGVPLCEAGCEMAKNGSAGPRKQVWCCPVKMGRIECCPHAPDSDPDWVCQPGTKLGPVKVIDVTEHLRIMPHTPRNSARYLHLYNQRSGAERSNSMKKETFHLEDARHRRYSLWFLRLALIAILQHARVWVAHLDPAAFFHSLLKTAAD